MVFPESMKVNTRLLPVKATYFFTLAGVASLLPYLPVYMRQAGLTPVEAGLIYGAMPFFGAVARPIFGAIADKLHKHKVVLIICMVMSGICHALLLAIPHHPVSTRPYNGSQITVNMTCGPTSSGLSFCPHADLMAMGCVKTPVVSPPGPLSSAPGVGGGAGGDTGGGGGHIGGGAGVYVNMTRSARDEAYVNMVDPLAGLRNCTMLCMFKPGNDLNELCIRYYGKAPNISDVCPIQREANNSLSRSSLFKKRNHLDRFSLPGQSYHNFLSDDFVHRINVAKFQMAVFVEELTHIRSSQHTHHTGIHRNQTEIDPQSICHKYVPKAFDYSGESYDHNWMLECDKRADLTCRMICHAPPENIAHTPGYDCTVKPPLYGKVFWLFFFMFMIAQIWFAPVFNIIDGLAYDFLGEDRDKWGMSRLFGTIGFMSLGLTSGLLMDVYAGDDGEKNYTAAFILFAVMNFIASIMVCFYKVMNFIASIMVCFYKVMNFIASIMVCFYKVKNFIASIMVCFYKVMNFIASIMVGFYKVSKDIKCAQIFDNMSDLLKQPPVLVLMAIILVFGIDTGVIEGFLFMHLQDTGASQLLLGLCMVMNCILEIFVLFFSSVIMRKIGHVNCFYIVFAAYFLRMILYSFLTNAWVALAIEPLHSITFGLFYAAASSYGSQITPPGMHGTIQGLIGGIYFGIGKGIGCVSGGKVFEVYGSHVMFRGYAIATAIVWLLYTLVQCTLLRNRSQEYRPSPTHEKHDTNGVKKPLGDSSCHGYSTNSLSQIQDDDVTFSKDRELLVFKDGAFEIDGDLGV